MVITTHSCHHLFNNYVLSVYNVQMLNLHLGTEDTAENKIGKNFCPHGAYIFRGKTICNISKVQYMFNDD